MNRIYLVVASLILCTPAWAGNWVADRYPAMSQAVLDMGVGADQLARFNVLYDALKAPGKLACDSSAPSPGAADERCTGNLGEQDAPTCGVLAAAGSMEARLLQLAHGIDHSFQLVLTCGAVRATAIAHKHSVGHSGEVQVDVRASGAASDSAVLWTRSSTAVADWAVAGPADRYLTSDEALAQVNDALRARAPVDQAWVAMATAITNDPAHFEALRVTLHDLAQSAADTARAAPTTPSDPAIHDALVARLDAYVHIADTLSKFMLLASGETTHAVAQLMLDQVSTTNTTADQAFMDAAHAFAGRYGLQDGSPAATKP